MSTVKTCELPLDRITAVAQRAGAAALELYRSQDAWVSEKSDGSPLTAADMASERIIQPALQAIDPSIPYLSEESAPTTYDERRSWERFWLVDPLDGTKEFIKRTGEFTINIALIERCQPVIGVIVAPAVGSTYYAAVDRGAWKHTDGNRTHKLVSRLADPTRPMRIVESVSHPSPDLEQFLEPYQVSDRLKIGSSLKFCLLAEGAADLYPRLGPTMEWDVAAGDCIYRCSSDGDPHPSPLVYNKESLLNDSFVLGLRPGSYVLPGHK